MNETLKLLYDRFYLDLINCLFLKHSYMGSLHLDRNSADKFPFGE